MDEKTKQIVYRVIIVIIVALISSYISRSGLDWLYSDKVKVSSRMPKGYIFGLVWAVIYTAYAYAWATSVKSDKMTKSMDVLFLVSIILNLAWVVAFFGLKNIELAKYIIVALTFVVAYQAYQQWKVENTLNTFLMLVYLSWLICATNLNFETSLVA